MCGVVASRDASEGALKQASPRPLLVLPLRNRAAFLSQSFDDDEGGIFVPGDIDAEIGDTIELELHFLEEDVRFRIRALVRWKRSQGRRAAPPGVGLSFPNSEASARAQLGAFARGEQVLHVERDRRLPGHVEARVEWSDDDDVRRAVTCRTDDVSPGGCFLLLDPPPPIGSLLRIRFKAPGALFSWLGLDAVVCWQRTAAAAGVERSGVGVQYTFDGERDRRRAEKLVAILKARATSLQVERRRPGGGSQPPRPATTPPSPSLLPRK